MLGNWFRFHAPIVTNQHKPAVTQRHTQHISSTLRSKSRVAATHVCTKKTATLLSSVLPSEYLSRCSHTTVCNADGVEFKPNYSIVEKYPLAVCVVCIFSIVCRNRERVVFEMRHYARFHLTTNKTMAWRQNGFYVPSCGTVKCAPKNGAIPRDCAFGSYMCRSNNTSTIRFLGTQQILVVAVENCAVDVCVFFLCDMCVLALLRLCFWLQQRRMCVCVVSTHDVKKCVGTLGIAKTRVFFAKVMMCVCDCSIRVCRVHHLIMF